MGQRAGPASSHTISYGPMVTAVATFCYSHVPLTANMVHTPLCPSAWYSMLQCHPNKHLVHFMLQGISNGFRIGLNNVPSALKVARFNLEGAQEHPEVVSNYLLTEISLGRIACPFPPQAIPQVHTSRFGVIPY